MPGVGRKLKSEQDFKENGKKRRGTENESAYE
jgi:hypothetical protein